MKHVKQKQGLGSCGCVAYAAILEITELDAIREVWGELRRTKGTCDHEIMKAFKARGINTHRVNATGEMKDLFWLEALSTHFPLYVAVREGRKKSTHAIAIADGMIYDGHIDMPVPIDIYANAIKLNVESILIIDHELPTYGKA